ncbi:hypothetical protein HR12_20555 [Microbacterium sp. SUBG005]|nr:hypothetical protein HR12_20555 [Microbacterium sp. SUBG005]
MGRAEQSSRELRRAGDDGDDEAQHHEGHGIRRPRREDGDQAPPQGRADEVVREEGVGSPADDRVQEHRVQQAHHGRLGEHGKAAGEGRGALVAVQLHRLALQAFRVRPPSLLQGAQPWREARAGLLGAGLRDADGG